MTGVRIAVVEDHALVRDGLVQLLRAQRPEHDVVYSGLDPDEALAARPDVVLLDLDLGSGVESSRVVADFASEDVRVLVVSAMGVPEVVRAAFLAGASGYVIKRQSTDALLESLDRVVEGESWLSPDLAAVFVDDDSPDRPKLSQQEQRALVLYATGLKLESVARRMGVAPSTAKQYLDRVRAKYAALGRSVRTKTDLYRAALRDGLVLGAPGLDDDEVDEPADPTESTDPDGPADPV